MQDSRLGMLIGGIIFAILALIYLVLVCWAWTEIKTAITVVDAAADMLRNTKRLLWINTGFFFLSIIAIMVWVGAFLGLLSMGDI